MHMSFHLLGALQSCTHSLTRWALRPDLRVTAVFWGLSFSYCFVSWAACAASRRRCVSAARALSEELGAKGFRERSWHE